MIIINGPIRKQISVNCGHNALGHGFRANATIGRALRLMIINIGGDNFRRLKPPASKITKPAVRVVWADGVRLLLP
jgi:hypothetical protein